MLVAERIVAEATYDVRIVGVALYLVEGGIVHVGNHSSDVFLSVVSAQAQFPRLAASGRDVVTERFRDDSHRVGRNSRDNGDCFIIYLVVSDCEQLNLCFAVFRNQGFALKRPYCFHKWSPAFVDYFTVAVRDYGIDESVVA